MSGFFGDISDGCRKRAAYAVREYVQFFNQRHGIYLAEDAAFADALYPVTAERDAAVIKLEHERELARLRKRKQRAGQKAEQSA